MPATHRPGCTSLVLFFCLAATAIGAERTWTSADGRTMRAEFVREVDGEVTFLKDGKLFNIPLEKLSAADQQVVRDIAAGKSPPDDSAETSSGSAPSPATDGRPATAAASAEGSEVRTPIPIVNRTWTGVAGEQISAKFVRIFGSNVVLSRAGKTVTIGFYELSGEDQEYLKELLRSRGQESLIPEPPPVREVEEASESTGGGGPAFSPPFSAGPSFGPSLPVPGMSSVPFGTGSDFAEQARQRHDEFVERVRQQAEQRRQEREARMAAIGSASPSGSSSIPHSSPGLDTPAPVPQFPSNRNEFSSDIVGECLSCKGKLTRLQAQGSVCPHCRVTWNFEQDEFGRRKPIAGTTASSPFGGASGGAAAMDPETKARAIRIGIMVGVIVGVLALVAVVIFVALVIAAASSRGARRYT